MENKKKLEDLHQQSLEHVNDYINAKEKLPEESKEKISNAKKEWHDAWLKLQEVMLELEQFEI